MDRERNDALVASELDNISFQPPPFEMLSRDPSAIVSWVETQINEGEGYLNNQDCYKNLGVNMRVFDAIFRDKTKSTLITNSLKYNIRKFCETLAEVREIAAYTSDVPGYKAMAEMLTKVAKCAYTESDFPFQILKVLQYATVMGIGYLWPKVVAEEYGFGERKLVFEALGLLDVLPVQVPSSNDVQDAYAVTIYEYKPLAEAHTKFPLFSHLLQPIGPRSYRTQLQARRLDYIEKFKYGDQGRSFGALYTEIRWTFVRDMRINTTGFELPMGDRGTTWFYKVPYVGQPIFGGMRNGQAFMRPAQIEDCRVYPNLRLIITANGVNRPLYDGPAFDWDSKIPVIQYTVDDWAWEPLGRSLVGDVASIETTIRKLERKIDAVITVTLNPPLGYNMTETGGPKIEHFDIFEEDVRIGVDGKPKETLQSVLPDEVRVGNDHFTFLKYLGDKELQQLGINDITSLTNLKANITSDAAEKMLETIGPVGKGIAARIEKGNKRVGERMKYLIPQWFDVERLIEYVGPDGIAPEMFDFDPKKMVPSHMPDEMVKGMFPDTKSSYDDLTRAKWFCKKLRLVSVPSTLIKITQMQEQMKFLQLKRGQAPISWLTVFKKLDIANPEEEIKKSFAEQEQLKELELQSQIKLMQKMKELGIDPSALGGGDQGGKPHAGGRPPSGQKPAKMAQKGGKGGTPRQVVKES